MNGGGPFWWAAARSFLTLKTEQHEHPIRPHACFPSSGSTAYHGSACPGTASLANARGGTPTHQAHARTYTGHAEHHPTRSTHPARTTAETWY
jgi:hypothetical protein